MKRKELFRAVRTLAAILAAFVCVFTAGMTSSAEDADVYDPGEKNRLFAEGNRVYFYNMESEEGCSDMILLESNGRWALIDAGHRYAETIRDENGTNWWIVGNSLSSQIEGKNGRDAMIWMIETLGVDHLDFIVGTHAHSDHIGGIPEITELKVRGDDGEIHPLVDGNTVYFYKTYRHTSMQEDDVGDIVGYSWHNQAFWYQAVRTVGERGGHPVDVSCGAAASDGTAVILDQAENLAAMEAAGCITGVSYRPGEEASPYDDRLSFTWQNMSVDLYHLFLVEGSTSENVNSLVTVITCGGQKVFLGADLDTEFRTEQRLSEVIAADHGPFSVAKMSHHGIYPGSNSRDWVDLLQPRILVSTNNWTDIVSPTPNGAYSSVKYYANRKYGTELYAAGLSDRMLAVDLRPDGVSVFNVTGTGGTAALASADSCRDSLAVRNGWSGWYEEIRSALEIEYFYFLDGTAVTGWRIIGGKRYHFDADGFLERGWLYEDGETYYLDDAGVTQIGICTVEQETYLFGPTGKLIASGDGVSFGWVTDGEKKYYLTEENRYLTGWKEIDGSWYFFGDDAACLTGWQDISGKRFHLDDDGVMQTGWQVIGGKKYFFGNDGAMRTGWVQSGGDWYRMDDDGVMQTGWQEVSGRWYRLGDDGVMRTGWYQESGRWYRLGDDGVMRTGWYQESGRWYLLGTDGVMRTGWQKDAGKWYLLGTDGTMKTGWQKDAGQWYLLGADGAMKTGWQKNAGKWYFLGTDGAMKTGWQKDAGQWYLLGGDGVMKTGWQKDAGKWYLLGADGAMQTGWRQESGTWYYLKSDGTMAENEWAEDSRGWCYLGNGGRPLKDKWIEEGGSVYYVDETGHMVTGSCLIGGAAYVFDSSGKLAEGKAP